MHQRTPIKHGGLARGAYSLRFFGSRSFLPTDLVTPRRIEFRVAVLRNGLTMYGVAEKLGVSCNHLILVLDGKRVGSAELEARIKRVMKV